MRVNLSNFLPPVPRDLIFGLIQAQGHFVLHLSFAMTIFFIKMPDKEVKCGNEVFELDMII